MGYVIAAYAVTLGGLAVYTLQVLRRGRALTRTVPPEEHPWR